MRSTVRKSILTAVALLLVVFSAPYLLLPWYSQWGTTDREPRAELTGDAIVPHPITGYTLATTIEAAPSEVWPWLVHMGQGRAGFYTHESIENLLGANIEFILLRGRPTAL